MVLELTSDNFDSEVRNNEGLVLIDFWADWCMPCKMMAPVFEEASAEFADKVKFVKLNTQVHEELAREFQITSIPCLVMTKGGVEVGRITGYMTKDILVSRVNEILDRL